MVVVLQLSVWLHIALYQYLSLPLVVNTDDSRGYHSGDTVILSDSDIEPEVVDTFRSHVPSQFATSGSQALNPCTSYIESHDHAHSSVPSQTDDPHTKQQVY